MYIEHNSTSPVTLYWPQMEDVGIEHRNGGRWRTLFRSYFFHFLLFQFISFHFLLFQFTSFHFNRLFYLFCFDLLFFFLRWGREKSPKRYPAAGHHGLQLQPTGKQFYHDFHQYVIIYVLYSSVLVWSNEEKDFEGKRRAHKSCWKIGLFQSSWCHRHLRFISADRKCSSRASYSD